MREKADIDDMAMQPDERFDEVLLSIAGQLGGIEPLFDTVFSFLLRKTDYFHVMKPGDNIGFKEGVAQQILLRSFSKFEQAAAAATKRAEAEKAKMAKKAPATKPPATVAAEKKPPAKTEEKKPPAAKAAAVPAAAAAPTPAARDELGSSTVRGSADGLKLADQQAATHLKEELDVPYNGGRTDKYHWEQTLADVTVHVPVPAGTRARDVVCAITRTHLTLKLKGAEEALIDADYPCDARNGQEIWERVKHTECYWNVGEAKGEQCVTIYLEKERESWWKAAVHGGVEIDTTKVDSTRDIYDYDGETQGAIRKIMFDQHQKRMGMPTSDETKNEDMLKQAWDAEGSPFKGQPFDPSRVNFNGGGGGGGGMAPGMPSPGGSDDAPVDVTED